MTRSSRPDRGAIAVMTAVSMLVLVVAGAAAIDVGKTVYVRNSLQAALDNALKAAAAAALSQPLNYTTADKQADSARIVKSYIRSNNPLSTAAASFNVDDSNDLAVQYTAGGAYDDTISATLNARVPLSFTKLLMSEIPVSVSGRIKRPRPVPLELSLALDVTSSMGETLPGGRTKMDELKAAAVELTDYVLQSDYSKVGIVPFAQQVNIGPGYAGAAWLDAKTNTVCDVPPCTSVCQPAVWGSCPQPDAPPIGCWVQNCDTTCQNCRTAEFQGCVPTRGTTANKVFTPLETIANPTNPRYVGQAVVCRVPTFVDLTAKADYSGTGATVIRDKINSLNYLTAVNQGNTYIPIGLIWGWNMLDPAVPLTSASASTGADRPTKSIVLITDGDNYWTPTGSGNGGVAGTNPATDALTLRVCTNIKNAGIKISTVALNIGTGTTLDMLRQCASSADDFYSIQNVSQLKTAFQKIGMSYSYNSLQQ